MLRKLWNFITVYKMIYLAKIAIKNIQRTVVLSRKHVMHVILHFQLDVVSVIVFAAFELLIPVFFG